MREKEKKKIDSEHWTENRGKKKQEKERKWNVRGKKTLKNRLKERK